MQTCMAQNGIVERIIQLMRKMRSSNDANTVRTEQPFMGATHLTAQLWSPTELDTMRRRKFLTRNLTNAKWTSMT